MSLNTFLYCAARGNRGDTNALVCQICCASVAKVPISETPLQCVLARAGSAPISQPKSLEMVAQVGVGMSKYLGG